MAETTAAEQRLLRFGKTGEDGYRYLPGFMRDFHDAKLLFKCIENKLGRQPEPFGVDWIRAQCYVVDTFLRFMALHGYTLQRTQRHGIEFCNIEQSLKEFDARQVESLKTLLAAPPSTH